MTEPLADAFERIAHHHWNAKPHLNGRVLSLALAAALLIELFEGRCIGFEVSDTNDDDRVIALRRSSRPRDTYGRQVLARIRPAAYDSVGFGTNVFAQPTPADAPMPAHV